MKKIIILLNLYILLTNILAQNVEDTIKLERKYIEINPFKNINGFFTTIERFPMYPDGEKGIAEYIKNKLNYPDEAKEKNISGTVVIGYLIETDGSIGETVVLESIHPLLDNEAIRVIEAMEKWKPAIQNGEPVKMRLKQKITFEW